ncbi:transcriptional regulator-like protein [Methyloglobulus morosus KoM1]|uniref:HTH-type transcriptional regulator n=1 Tax=Methyloglobulus morosus KoM1 TaxID=1116472 RepID=V5BYG0_9GAMM|nr:GbsR/MarR family transcriptional regulator [Methyloglobulus morosus]ESS69548.1 transcriptional regulator-like protein [Methyloglobulus morosus KoM1]
MNMYNSAMILNPVAQRFILHWGEMGSKWGVNRTVAQVHALLYFVGKPMPADEITETLGVARSNVSNSLKELQNWNLIQVVHIMGDRRDHFTTSSDVWVLFKTVVHERKEREFDPTISVLRDCLESPDLDKEDAEAQQRIKEALGFMEVLSTWGDQMLKLEPSTLMKVLKLGSKIKDLLSLAK